MGVPAVGALAMRSPLRVSPPPGGATAPPPAIGVGHNRYGSPGSVKLSPERSDKKPGGSTLSHSPKHVSVTPADGMVSPVAFGLNKNCPALLEPFHSKEKLLSPAAATTQRCILCHREADATVCNRCATRLKIRLLDKNLDSVLQAQAASPSASSAANLSEEAMSSTRGRPFLYARATGHGRPGTMGMRAGRRYSTASKLTRTGPEERPTPPR